jgi:molybdopterin synthase catalytic subunit
MDLVRIQQENFSVDEEIARVKANSKSIGGIVTFLGIGRNISKGKEILKLGFEHYPGMAEKKLLEIRKKAIDDFNLIEASIIHRIGAIEIGENIVLIVAAAQHRQSAFKACEWAISELKRITPIWKREITVDGEVWVEAHP